MSFICSMPIKELSGKRLFVNQRLTMEKVIDVRVNKK